VNALATVGEWSAFTATAFLSALRSLLRPSWVAKPLYDALIGALPLAAVAGLAVGVVIWAHTRGVLARTSPGAVDYLPTFLAAAVLLELAPIAAGLIAAARTGASLGAELATMKIGEQVEAIELLGVSPTARLVGPRVLACALATPLLHVLIVALSLGGGYLAESVAGGTTWLRYRDAVLSELRLAEVTLAGLKTVAFGLLVGATGCFVGLRAEGGSEGVGRATTRAVVASCLLVLVADVFLVGAIRLVVN
jgi:phospholipid/cholesterol/gamma-HCH transport system permease protein